MICFVQNNETPVGEKKLFTDKSVHNDKSLFVKNWVNLGGAFDKATLNFPELYPDGCVQYEIKKGKGKIPKNPRIGWANISKKGKYTCMGVFACPKFGEDDCFFFVKNQKQLKGDPINTVQVVASLCRIQKSARYIIFH